MPQLTKRFTRDSLKRASGGGTSRRNTDDDVSKTEMIRVETIRARNHSMRNQNIINQQRRRYRSLSRSKLEETNGPKDSSHPSNNPCHSYNESEILTQMSSLTEPTWALSDLGRSDIHSLSHHKNTRNERNKIRYDNKSAQIGQVHEDHTTEDQKLISVGCVDGRASLSEILLDNRDDMNNVDGCKKKTVDNSHSNSGHHERASVRTEGIEIYRIEIEERENAPYDTNSDADIENLPTQHTRNSDLLKDQTADDTTRSTFQTTNSAPSSTQPRSSRDPQRTRGRSSRPRSDRTNRKRASSISSRRSTKSGTTATTAVTLSKHSSCSTVSTHKSSSGRASKSHESRSSSVPISSSARRRKTRVFSVPPSNPTSKDIEVSGVGSIKKVPNKSPENRGEGSEQLSIALDSNNSKSPSLFDASSKLGDTVTLSSQSYSNANNSISSNRLESDTSVALSSTIQAARMSLRHQLRQSNSSRSISSTPRETSTHGGKEGKSVEFQRSLSVTPISSISTAGSKRIFKEERKSRRGNDRERRNRRRKRREKKKHSSAQQKNELEKDSKTECDQSREEPQNTTMKTLLYDVLVFNLLLLVSIPTHIFSYLWSRMLSTKWNPRGKNVLVAGANSALASETARQFASQGANLVLIFHSGIAHSKGYLNSLAQECLELGSPKTRTYSADLSNTISTELVFRQAAKDFSDIFDIVVLNGDNKSHGCLFEEILDAHHIENMIKENSVSTMVALHHALKKVPKSCDSRIIMLSHTSGIVASPYKSVYGASQHALKGFCDSIRMELVDTYTERRAPKICFASFPELIGQNTHCGGHNDHRITKMGAASASMRTHTWASTPLQQAVHGLLLAVTSGERAYGAPQHIKAWNCAQAIAPRWTDFSIYRHARKTQYRPAKTCKGKLFQTKEHKEDGASVSNKTWS